MIGYRYAFGDESCMDYGLHCGSDCLDYGLHYGRVRMGENGRKERRGSDELWICG